MERKEFVEIEISMRVLERSTQHLSAWLNA